MSLLRSWKSILLVLVVFVAGMFCGAVGAVRAIQREYRNKLDETTWVPRTLDWFRNAASLSPEQEEQIRPIVESAVARMKELRDESEAQRQSVVKDLLISVALQLPDPQREQLTRAAKAAAAKTSPWTTPTIPAASPSGSSLNR